MKPTWQAWEAFADLEATAAREGVDLHWVDQWESAEAVVGTRSVFVPRPNTPFEYLVALHEMGHVADKASALVHRMDPPASEAAAWRWAVANAAADLLAFMTHEDWYRVGSAWVTSVAPQSC